MTELKTMKELEEHHKKVCDDHCGILMIDITAEAVKWIKACCNKKKKCLGCHRMMKFHNITEEDLKDS